MDAPTPRDRSTTPALQAEARRADAALVHAARRGERGAHSAIWRRYAPLVRSRMRRCFGRQDIDDHVQEVFLRLFQVLPDLRDPDALRSFIIGITLHVAGSEARRRRRRHWLQLTPSGDLPEPRVSTGAEPPHEGQHQDEREAVARLTAILEGLAPATSRVIALRYVEGKELTEVAAAVDVSLATAKRHLARASMRLEAVVRGEPVLAGYLNASAARRRRRERALPLH
jgi:RNA polymerase sigma-70 factor (ECF subfamily)